MNKAARRRHMDRVAALGCVVCRNLGYGETPAEPHHINCRTMARKASDYETIPLCVLHHNAGIHGVSVHAGLETWERKYGTEQELLEQVLRELG